MTFARVLFTPVCLAVLGLAVGIVPRAAPASEPKETLPAHLAESFERLAVDYAATIRPLMADSCLPCHASAEPKGDLDLERFAGLADARRDAKAWLKVVEMLENGEMPPKDAPPLANEDRQRLLDWSRGFLDAEALASAGDPGPLPPRKLNNAEYTYTIRDLTHVELDPAREFPADSAAGEGFTNAGGALVMSPALLSKYLDAAKDIAGHAVLLPDGIRFSPSTTSNDWTNDALARIRALYAEYSDASGGSRVNLQGIVFDTNAGGRLPVERYLEATLIEREPLRSGAKTIAQVAQERGLSAKYLGILWQSLHGEPSALLDGVREHWRRGTPAEAIPLAEEIARWQRVLWRFTSVGHIGKVGGPKAWQEPVTPLVSRADLRLPLPPPDAAGNVTVYLASGDAGDGREHDHLIWDSPRLVAPGRPELALRDVRDFTREMTARRERLFAAAASALDAAAEIALAEGAVEIETLASRHSIDSESLAAWLDYLGIGDDSTPRLDLFTNKLPSAAGYEFVQGWGAGETPMLYANSSDSHVRIPGNMKPHGVCVHPSPTLNVAVGWRSPITGVVDIEGAIQHAHPECGNGVVWALETRRGATRQRLASGVAHGPKSAPIGPIASVSVRAGDFVSLLVGPRDGNHGCDLTDLEFNLTRRDAAGNWRLTEDISPDVLAGNPHADRQGNPEVWHFYTSPVEGSAAELTIPAGSLLARWQAATDPKEKHDLAIATRELLSRGPPAGTAEDHPDAKLRRELASLGGPLLSRAWSRVAAQRVKSAPPSPEPASPTSPDAAANFGLDSAMFGKSPDGLPLDADSLLVQAPSVIEIVLPADLAAGAELVTSAQLRPGVGHEGTARAWLSATRPDSNDARPEAPTIVMDGSAARGRFERDFEEFRRLFPIALCYTKIVPVDEVVTLTLFYREDEPLCRLMLDDETTRRLDGLWEELHFVSQDPLRLVDAFAQLMEYATQDADPSVFEPMREPIMRRADEFRRAQIAAEPKHLDAALEFAARAFRRPLTDEQSAGLRSLYASLRENELPHEEAIRFTLARILISPAFLYRLERASPGSAATPVTDLELASRLSYFLWSSTPDETLLAAAAQGELTEPQAATRQAKRMLADPRARRLASEFALQWLQIYDFDSLDEKSERHFPEFATLRGAMREEVARFFTDLFQRDGSLEEMLDSDHFFLNGALAQFYGVPDVTGNEWRRVEGARNFGRGGILGLAAVLAKQSGASRTSPILRGAWISETLLGEKLPKPPKDVPRLPEDETATDGLTVRQLVERHVSDSRCSSCHRKIDPYGFALEHYDAIGRRRELDHGGRAIDARVTLPDGAKVENFAELRTYLATTRRDAVLRQFCRKLLGFALGRGTRLSDQPLLNEMWTRLAANGFRFSVAVETIVESRQFREIRGKDAVSAETP